MDLNMASRKRERAIAHEVAEELLRATKPLTDAAPSELLAHHFGLVCQRLNFVPDEWSTTRVLGFVSKEIARKHHEVERLQRKVDSL